MKVGIFMGTFDPPHIGHFQVIEGILREGLVDKVIILISPGNPFKSWAPSSLNIREKLFMLQGYPDVSRGIFLNSTPYPPDSDGKYYSYQQLRVLLKDYPELKNEELYIICGEDVNPAIWKESGEILEKFGILRVHRGKSSSFDSINLWPEIDVSSTWIRECIRDNKCPLPFITAEAWKFIRESGLYK